MWENIMAAKAIVTIIRDNSASRKHTESQNLYQDYFEKDIYELL